MDRMDIRKDKVNIIQGGTIEEKLKERIGFLRAKFMQGIDVEKLVAILKRDQLLPPERIGEIDKQTTNSGKLDKLMDEIVIAKDSAYPKLLSAVEQCRPLIYSVSPTAYSQRNSLVPGTESCSASLTSDSEDDVIRARVSGVTDAYGKDHAGYRKLTNILTAHHYGHSASSSFPILNDRCSPLPVPDDRHHERHSPLEILRKQISSENRYDWFKVQFEGALNELELLKQQHADKISQLSKENETFRNLYKKSEAMTQQYQAEIHVIKLRNVELVAAQKQLQEAIVQLEKLREEDKREMADLRTQHHKVVASLSGSGTGASEADVLTDLYDASLEKNELLRKDYDMLRDRYADLASVHSAACCQLEAMADLRKQLDDMRMERDEALRDRVAFQQQCTAAFQNLDQTIHENRKIKANLMNLRQEHDGCIKDQRQFNARQLQLQNEISKALAERDAAFQEYAQVMSERDTVHKEIEQLQDKLSEMTKLKEKFEKEKTSFEQEVERLKQELSLAISARDKYKLESQSALENRSKLESERLELQREFQLMEQQRDIARKERHQALEQMDVLIKETYEKTQKEKAEEMGQVAKETESLKKQIDKIKNELTDAEQEALIATQRRDWAFSEIDKIVQERESIRTLCDNLRRDRDRAVSELAKALRNSDDCEKQKNEAVKELKDLREKYEAVVERDARRQQLNSIGHNHSRDSAIDADLQEWETETLEIELETGDGRDIGFEILGGRDDPQFPSDNSLFVSHVTKGGNAEGKLRVNDLLLKINNLDTTNIDRRCAMQALHKPSKSLILVVRRRKSSLARTWLPLQLFVSSLKESSIQVEQGLFVSAVHCGDLIGKDGLLPSVGDRLISINHQQAESLTVREAMKLLTPGSQPIVLEVWRQSSPLSSTGSSPTPTTASVLSPLSDQISSPQSAAMSKSDTLAIHSGMWDSTSDSARSGGGSSKNLRSSGSQTDSLDSPGPSPPKTLRNHDHDKQVRHSMPVLDKAKETVEKIFRSRHKSQERERDHDRECQRVVDDLHTCQNGLNQDKDCEHDRDRERIREDCDKKTVEEVSRVGDVILVSNMTQTKQSGQDDVIAEFPTSAFIRTSPDSRNKSRKREYEADSNSGTWPKSRGGSSMTSGVVPSTVSILPVKERPSIKDPFLFEPPHQHNGNGHNNVRHMQQNSDSSVKYPVTVAAPQPVIPSKTTHFSVGIMQTPNTMVSPLVVGRPSFPRPPLNAQIVYCASGDNYNSHYQKTTQTPLRTVHYTTPHSHHQPRTCTNSSGQSSFPKPEYIDPRLESSPVQPVHKTGFKSHHPSPAPRYGQNIEKPWPVTWIPSAPHHPHSPHDVPTARPISLEVPYTLHYGDVSGDSADARVASPVGSSIGSSVRSCQSSQYKYPSVSSTGSQYTNRPVMMPRYSSPPGTFTAISPDHDLDRSLYIGNSSHPASDRYSAPSPSQQNFSLGRITPTLSDDFVPPQYPRSNGPNSRPLSDVELRGSGAYPKHDKRICIPSNSSVATKSGSVEIVSDRSSPVSPVFRFEHSGSGKGKRLSPSSAIDEYYLYSPRPHETRTITFEKSSEPVGFQIQGGPAGGIFVSAVNENSLASQAGLVIGDQLLEVCGINMRNASHEHAVTVLRQCGENLIMKVQYNPEKYIDGFDVSSISSVVSSVTTSPVHSNNLSSGESEQSTPKHHTPQRSKSNSSADAIYDCTRVLHIKRQKGDCGPGFTIVGGNAVGIFVHEIQSNSPAASKLQRGDMILKYNDISFKSITAEQAILELNKPCSTMRLAVVSNVTKYNKVQNIPGDRIFIRANFGRSAEGEGELDFRNDDILFVESTVHRGTLGLWLAWVVDERGNKLRCGTIPSRLRLEDEIVLRRSHSDSWSLSESDDLKGSRRGSGSARRSFFRRRRHHRNNSKDSRDLTSFSDVSLNSESVPILDESVLGYTQVERIEYDQIRPVVLLAPHAEALIKKLTSESPDKYKYCEPCAMRVPVSDMEQSLADGRLVDYWKKDDQFECIQVTLIREICDKKIHCLMNVNPRAIERLHRLKIYPIVIFVRHKSSKHIREIRDPQFLAERVSNKSAKDLFEHFTKMEHEYGHLFSGIIQGGSLAELCMHIKSTINHEQKKAIWVTVSSL